MHKRRLELGRPRSSWVAASTLIPTLTQTFQPKRGRKVVSRVDLRLTPKN